MRASGAVYIMARMRNTYPTRPIMEMQSVLVMLYRDWQWWNKSSWTSQLKEWSGRQWCV